MCFNWSDLKPEQVDDETIAIVDQTTGIAYSYQKKDINISSLTGINKWFEQFKNNLYGLWCLVNESRRIQKYAILMANTRNLKQEIEINKNSISKTNINLVEIEMYLKFPNIVNSNIQYILNSKIPKTYHQIKPLVQQLIFPKLIGYKLETAPEYRFLKLPIDYLTRYFGKYTIVELFVYTIVQLFVYTRVYLFHVL